ncbi:hypothetical protein GH733_017487 [Mirounga leonina]|nr:hypothetical protein GH733_017487 [Mirounga leonina]
MSHPGPLSRNLSWNTFLREHGPEVPEVPGMTDLVEYYDPGPSPDSTNPDDVAMRLAFIGDEMEVRWMLPRIGELPGMAMYSLAFTYNQTGLRGVLRSFMDGLSNLRESIRIWSFLTFRNRECLPLADVPALPSSAQQPTGSFSSSLGRVLSCFPTARVPVFLVFVPDRARVQMLPCPPPSLPRSSPPLGRAGSPLCPQA